MKDTDDGRALEAPPRTLEVKHFAKARAAELLSLHAALKKRKAAREEEGQDKSTKDSISLPRHLRRRTSSYNRRHCPLPWLYKQKKRTTDHARSSTHSALHPEKKSRIQRKESNVNSTEHDLSISLEKEGKSDQCKRKRLCRSLRRLLELKPGGVLVANEGTRRLSTHVWHAKRFSMEKKFGYYLPIGRPGKYAFFEVFVLPFSR
jgi:ribonuclease P/MRP protein subunit POP1